MIRAFGELAALYLLELLESARDRAARLWRRIRREAEPEPAHLHMSTEDLVAGALGLMTISILLNPHNSKQVSELIKASGNAYREIFRAATGDK